MMESAEKTTGYAEAAPETGLTRQLAARGTVRNFKPDSVPESWLEAIVVSGMRAPTSSNRQEYSVIRVKDLEKRRTLVSLCTRQQHIVDCAAFYAICADQTRVAHAMSMYGKDYPTFGLEGGLVATVDAALVGVTMSYVAESFGLSTVLVGAMRNNPVEVARVLGLPPRCYAVFGLCVGWAVKPPLPKPRHDLEAVLHTDSYDPGAHDRAIRAYDAALADYYRQRGVETVDAAWSGVMAQKYDRPTRPGLRSALRELGFHFD